MNPAEAKAFELHAAPFTVSNGQPSNVSRRASYSDETAGVTSSGNFQLNAMSPGQPAIGT